MDKILKELKDISSEDPSLSAVYDRIKDCEVFLDFLIKTGKINPEDKEYVTLLNDIEQYRLFKREGKYFSELDKEIQKRITKLMERYEEDMNFYKAYEFTIKALPNNPTEDRTQSARS